MTENFTNIRKKRKLNNDGYEESSLSSYVESILSDSSDEYCPKTDAKVKTFSLTYKNAINKKSS